MPNTLIEIINVLKVPKVILRYIIMNFIDLPTIKNLLFIVKEMNVLDDYSKNMLTKANKGFQWNCGKGNLIVAQWLYSLGGVDIHADNEYAFRWSCRNGHLIVAKWLYSLGEGMDLLDPSSPVLRGQGRVNIHADNECAFQACCYMGHLAVAQCLYSIGNIDIHANDEHVFRWSCLNGHRAVAKWLYSLGGVNTHVYNNMLFNLSDKNFSTWLRELK